MDTPLLHGDIDCFATENSELPPWAEFVIAAVPFDVPDTGYLRCESSIDDDRCSVASPSCLPTAHSLRISTQLRTSQRTTMAMSRRILRAVPLLPLLLLLLWTPAAVLARNKRKHGNPLARSVRVLNESGVKIDLFWIHPETRQLADSHSSGEGVMYGAETGISSYVGHTFEVQEMPGRFGECLHKLCRKAYFTVNRNEEQCKYLFHPQEHRHTSIGLDSLNFCIHHLAYRVHHRQRFCRFDRRQCHSGPGASPESFGRMQVHGYFEFDTGTAD